MGAYEYQDVDDDGIMDSWEEIHFGSMYNCEPYDDPDDDRYSNFDELLFYMNPKVWSFYLETVFTDQVDMEWRMVNGTNYQVQCSSDLTSNVWDNVGSMIIGNQLTNAHFNAAFDASSSSKFYRVITVP